VADAYLAGLHARIARGDDVSRVASVASFFVSRIDTVVDSLIAMRLKEVSGGDKAELLRRLPGTAAIANAKLAYEWYRGFIRTERWQSVAANGARPQRLLWASTSTKNPQYRDVLYVEGLIGPETINTITPATLEAFSDHGQARVTLTENIDQARETMEGLAEAGISIDAVSTQLLDEGIQLFVKAFEKLLDGIDRKLTSLQ
jgi:transaldolase/glucose-6-phosphate isomerase